MLDIFYLQELWFLDHCSEQGWQCQEGKALRWKSFLTFEKTFFLLLSYLRYSLYFSFIPFLLLSYLRYLSFLWTSLLTAFIPAMGAMVDDHNPLTGEDFLTFLVPFSNELWAWVLLSVLIASKIHFKLHSPFQDLPTTPMWRSWSPTTSLPTRCISKAQFGGKQDWF